MDYEQILYEVRDGIATVTLNRPEKLNAWTMRMGAEVQHAFRQADKDDAVRVIIITGAGKGYCAGADMNMLQGLQHGGAEAELGPGDATLPADADDPSVPAAIFWPGAVPVNCCSLASSPRKRNVTR